MITINVRAIVVYGLLCFIVWISWPAWVWVAGQLIQMPPVRWFGAGLILGVAIKANWAWNAALSYRRQQAIEKAEREYAQDRRKVV